MASREGPPQASSRQAAEDRRAGGVSGSPFAIMRPSGKQWYTNLIPVVPPEIDGFLIDSPSPIPTLERWHSPEPPPQQSIASGGDTPYTFKAIEPAAQAAVDAAGKEAAAEKGRPKHTPIAPRRKNPRYPWRRPAPPKLQNVPDFVMCPSTFRIKTVAAVPKVSAFKGSGLGPLGKKAPEGETAAARNGNARARKGPAQPMYFSPSSYSSSSASQSKPNLKNANNAGDISEGSSDEDNLPLSRTATMVTASASSASTCNAAKVAAPASASASNEASMVVTSPASVSASNVAAIVAASASTSASNAAKVVAYVSASNVAAIVAASVSEPASNSAMVAASGLKFPNGWTAERVLQCMQVQNSRPVILPVARVELNAAETGSTIGSFTAKASAALNVTPSSPLHEKRVDPEESKKYGPALSPNPMPTAACVPDHHVLPATDALAGFNCNAVHLSTELQYPQGAGVGAARRSVTACLQCGCTHDYPNVRFFGRCGFEHPSVGLGAGAAAAAASASASASAVSTTRTMPALASTVVHTAALAAPTAHAAAERSGTDDSPGEGAAPSCPSATGLHPVLTPVFPAFPAFGNCYNMLPKYPMYYPLQPFSYFVSDVTPLLLQRYPEMTFEGVTAIVGKLWNGQDEAGRAAYHWRAQRDQERYDHEMHEMQKYTYEGKKSQAEPKVAAALEPPQKRGRPKGSKNKATLASYSEAALATYHASATNMVDTVKVSGCAGSGAAAAAATAVPSVYVGTKGVNKANMDAAPAAASMRTSMIDSISMISPNTNGEDDNDDEKMGATGCDGVTLDEKEDGGEDATDEDMMVEADAIIIDQNEDDSDAGGLAVDNSITMDDNDEETTLEADVRLRAAGRWLHHRVALEHQHDVDRRHVSPSHSQQHSSLSSPPAGKGGADGTRAFGEDDDRGQTLDTAPGPAGTGLQGNLNVSRMEPAQWQSQSDSGEVYLYKPKKSKGLGLRIYASKSLGPGPLTTGTPRSSRPRRPFFLKEDVDDHDGSGGGKEGGGGGGGADGLAWFKVKEKYLDLIAPKYECRVLAKMLSKGKKKKMLDSRTASPTPTPAPAHASLPAPTPTASPITASPPTQAAAPTSAPSSGDTTSMGCETCMSGSVCTNQGLDGHYPITFEDSGEDCHDIGNCSALHSDPINTDDEDIDNANDGDSEQCLAIAQNGSRKWQFDDPIEPKRSAGRLKCVCEVTGCTLFAQEKANNVDTRKLMCSRHATAWLDEQISTQIVDGSDNVCHVCKDGGSLVCCDGASCSRVYHIKCMSSSDQDFFDSGDDYYIDGDADLEEWFCPDCSNPQEQEHATTAVATHDITTLEAVLGSKALNSKTATVATGSPSEEPLAYDPPLKKKRKRTKGTLGTAYRNVCKVAQCNHFANKRDLCSKHGGKDICSFDGCTKCPSKRGLCVKHGGFDTCNFKACKLRAIIQGRCEKHFKFSRQTVQDPDSNDDSGGNENDVVDGDADVVFGSNQSSQRRRTWNSLSASNAKSAGYSFEKVASVSTRLADSAGPAGSTRPANYFASPQPAFESAGPMVGSNAQQIKPDSANQDQDQLILATLRCNTAPNDTVAQSWNLRADNIVGRYVNGVQTKITGLVGIDSHYISAIHAEISIDDRRKIKIRDMNSGNKTYIGARKKQTALHPFVWMNINDGETIIFASVVTTIHLASDDEDASDMKKAKQGTGAQSSVQRSKSPASTASDVQADSSKLMSAADVAPAIVNDVQESSGSAAAAAETTRPRNGKRLMEDDEGPKEQTTRSGKGRNRQPAKKFIDYRQEYKSLAEKGKAEEAAAAAVKRASRLLPKVKKAEVRKTVPAKYAGDAASFGKIVLTSATDLLAKEKTFATIDIACSFLKCSRVQCRNALQSGKPLNGWHVMDEGRAGELKQNVELVKGMRLSLFLEANAKWFSGVVLSTTPPSDLLEHNITKQDGYMKFRFDIDGEIKETCLHKARWPFKVLKPDKVSALDMIKIAVAKEKRVPSWPASTAFSYTYTPNSGSNKEKIDLQKGMQLLIYFQSEKKWFAGTVLQVVPPRELSEYNITRQDGYVQIKFDSDGEVMDICLYKSKWSFKVIAKKLEIKRKPLVHTTLSGRSVKTVAKPTCKVFGCSAGVENDGLCRPHYTEVSRKMAILVPSRGSSAGAACAASAAGAARIGCDNKSDSKESEAASLHSSASSRIRKKRKANINPGSQLREIARKVALTQPCPPSKKREPPLKKKKPLQLVRKDVLAALIEKRGGLNQYITHSQDKTGIQMELLRVFNTETGLNEDYEWLKSQLRENARKVALSVQ